MLLVTMKFTPLYTKHYQILLMINPDILEQPVTINQVYLYAPGHIKHNHASLALGLVQDCSNSSALAMELLQSCTKPSIWSIWQICLIHKVQSGPIIARSLCSQILTINDVFSDNATQNLSQSIQLNLYLRVLAQYIANIIIYISLWCLLPLWSIMEVQGSPESSPRWKAISS